MKKVSGTITFLGGVGVTIFLIIFILLENPFDNDSSTAGFLCILFLIVSISAIHYSVSSKFWSSELSVFEALDRENEIIKKRIEKLELLASLEKLEGK